MAVIAIDSLNYVIEREEVLATFRNIYTSLAADGVAYYSMSIQHLKWMKFLWKVLLHLITDVFPTYGKPKKGMRPHSVYSELAFFVRNENGLYKRFDEVHYQRTFSVHDYVEMLTKLVFQLNEYLRIGKMSHLTNESERIFFQVRK